ncbi:MAG: S9 family peptidase [Bdellovibrionota bacterium]
MAKKIPHEVTHHGIVLSDPYSWIREKSNPEVIALLNEENKATEAALFHTKNLQSEIYEEIVSRIRENDRSYPVEWNGYEYFSSIEKGQDYRCHWRKKASDGSTQLLLDINQEKKSHPFFHIGDFKVSPNHTHLAYSFDIDGSENYHIVIKNIETGNIIDESISKSDGQIEWGLDEKTIFYSTLDAVMRPYQVYKHTVGQTQQTDTCIFEEKDLSYYVHFTKSKSKRFLIIQSDSKLTTEAHVVDLIGNSNLRCIQPRTQGVEYYVEHHDNQFLIFTNLHAKNFKIVTTNLEHTEQKHWKDLIPHQTERSITDFEVFATHLVVSERYKGLSHFRFFNFETHSVHEPTFDEPSYVISSDINPSFDQDFFRFSYSSPLQEKILYHYEFETKKLMTLEKKQTPNLAPENYIVERIEAISHDQVHIPITVSYRKDHRPSPESPLFLMGYGAYGICSEPSFSPSLFSLMDRGFVVATAHIRGGGECGKTWHEQGRFFQKKNTFQDFISCAEHLIHIGYTKAKKIAIRGGSAGGLLMGAVTNMRPDLWAAVLSLVPFVDVMNTMTDETLPLTVTEYEEWGNPQQKEYFEYMHSYSPYDNLKPSNYPPILATGGLNDPRVSYWEPTKWVLALREHQKNKNHPILLKMEMEAGHKGPSGRYALYKEVALHYAFVIDQLKST